MRSQWWDGDFVETQPFGVNPSWYAQYRIAGHNGADFALPVGTQLYAGVDATVIEVAFDRGGYGWYIKLRDREGGDWLLAHLSDTGATKVGDDVIAGTPIALSGNTGNSSGPHLHIAHRPWPPLRGWPYDGYVDPKPFLLRQGP